MFLLIGISKVFGQGFDWDYSARLPYQIPSDFIGLNFDYGVISNTGSFGFLEDFIECCEYKAGKGSSFGVSGVGEHWQNGGISLIGGIGFLQNTSEFSTIVEVPRSDGKIDYTSQYKYYLNESRSYGNLLFGVKSRLGLSHFAYGILGNLKILIHSQATHKEQILSPASEKFIDGSQTRVIQNGILSEYNKLIFTPELFVNYDYSLYLNYYASIKVTADVPLMSVIQNQKWFEWKFGLSVSFYKAVK